MWFRVFLALLVGLVVAGCMPADEVFENGEYQSHELPVGFDRSAGFVSWNEDGDPAFEVVSTSLPALHFSGYNASADTLAYTSLEKVAFGEPGGRMPISYEDSLSAALEGLVPTGELIIEREGEGHVVSQEGEFVVSAAWSPVDPDIVAYGYTAESASRIAVVNVETGQRIREVEGDVVADVFLWQDDGEGLVLYVSEASDSLEGEPLYHAEVFDVATGQYRVADSRGVRDGAVRPSTVDDTMEIVLSEGTLLVSSYMGGDENVFLSSDPDGRLSPLVFRADQIRTRSDKGIVFVNGDDSSLTLFAFRGGKGREPVQIASITSVNYYIPSPAGSTVNFTQVGQGFSGGGCSVWDHTSSSTMKYAVDIQISGTTYDEVLASAPGTVSSFYSAVSCNSLDNAGCSIYASPCSANGGWGNTVVLAHSDGFYTKYTHLEYGAHFAVATVGASAAAGCWLADEGGTGYSTGNKNGCGDHLHFQKQSSSGLSGTSVSFSFVEDSSITSTDCTSKTPTIGGMSCAL